MREDLEQQEQMQNLKAFWKANGKWITSSLLILFLIVGSINGWKLWNNYNKEKASKILTNLEKNIEAQNTDIALRLYQEISEDHPNTLQAGLAGCRSGWNSGSFGSRRPGSRDARQLGSGARPESAERAQDRLCHR